jgi:hypothetical protein
LGGVADEEEDDELLLFIAEARCLTDDNRRHDLYEVLRRFGLSVSDLIDP